VTLLAAAEVARDTAMLQRYTAAWRWHFFAGIVVIPFLLVLASTGLIMLYYSSVQSPLGEQLYVSAAAGAATSPTAQQAAAQAAMPNGAVALYIPAPAADRPAQFEVLANGSTYAIDVNPYTTEVLRIVDKDSTLYALAHRIHGTLLLGEVGDAIVEVVAGLALLMLATGIYMWRHQRSPAAVGRRNRWQRLHRLSGLYAAVVLCFFLLSGLAWTNIWGGKWVQAWGSFPAEKWGPVALADDTHGAMNHGEHKAVPWGLEQTPMPASAPAHEHHASTSHATPSQAPIAIASLDSVDRLARTLGFGPRYRINLPQQADGVYTISTTSMNGETEQPGDERTVHVDRRNGKVLAQVGFDDYSLLAKSMAVGVSVHQGSMGWWSIALDALACMVVIFLCISGTLMWWLRRPARSGWLPVPPRAAALPLRSSLAVLLLALGIAFPLLGAALACGILVRVSIARNKTIATESVSEL
jgi:uncharacterized iron-regulated membrane protein